MAGMKPGPETLSRRERQIMDIVYQRGRATVAEIADDLPDPPSYSAVRALVAILERKGHLRHQADGPRYVYFPVRDRRHARRRALRHLVETFFEGSVGRAAAALLDLSDEKLSDDELTRLEALVARARKDGR